MDLFCPHCSKRVTVPDSSAGQVTSCPLCAKQFMTPSLAPPPAPVPPPPAPSLPPVVDTYGMGPASAPTPRTPLPAPTRPAAPPEPPPPPPPPGEYTRSYSLYLGKWLAFVPIACVVLVFILSFFSWHYVAPVLPPTPANAANQQNAFSLWSLAFTDHGEGQFLAYVLLMFPAGFFTLVAFIFDLGVIPPQPQLAPILTWKNLVAGVFLTLAFAMLCIDYLIHNFAAAGNPIAVPEKVAIRLQFLAVLASFLIFWLELRKLRNKPLPKIEFRW